MDEVRTVAKGWRWARRPLVPASVEREREPAHDFPTAWGRTPAGRAVREVVQRFGLAPLLRFEVETEVCGQEVLDTIEPPAVFILNHSSHLDAPTILTSLPTKWRRKAVVGAAADYFFDTWYRSVATTIVFNAFPIARGGGLRSARMARQLIAEGWSLVLFPEGTRTTDGWVGDFRTGASWLAIEAGVPVVPVAIIGAYQAMPRGRSWPKPGRPPVRVRFGKPIRPEVNERPAAFSQRLREGLGMVLEEDRSGWWNAIRLESQGELFDPSGPQVAKWRRIWETSRPVPTGRAKSVWAPEDHGWQTDPLWSGTGWADPEAQASDGEVFPTRPEPAPAQTAEEALLDWAEPTGRDSEPVFADGEDLEASLFEGDAAQGNPTRPAANRPEGNRPGPPDAGRKGWFVSHRPRRSEPPR